MMSGKSGSWLLWCMALACAGGLGIADQVAAQDEFRPQMAQIAKATAWVMRSIDARSVAIGQFAGPATFGAASGPGLQMILTEELKKLGLTVADLGGDLGVQGRYFVKQVGAASNVTVIEASFTDPNGQVLESLTGATAVAPPPSAAPGGGTTTLAIEKGVIQVPVDGSAMDTTGAGAVAQLLGANVSLDRSLSGPARGRTSQEQVLATFNEPTVTVDSRNWVSATPGSPFAVRIVSQGENKPIQIIKGQPFVDLKMGESFYVAIRNGSSQKASAVLTLDGVNSFAFSKTRYTSGPKLGEPRYSRWIIDPQEDHVVQGWDQDDETVKQFLITDFANSAAAKLRSTSGLGTISVVFRPVTPIQVERPAPRPRPQPRPYYPPPRYRMRPGEAGAPGPGIGIGEDEEQQSTATTVKYEHGDPVAVVTIRYTKPKE